MQKNQPSHSGFTLIELLVTVTIISVLAVVVVLTLNIPEMLRQSRDESRLADMKTLNGAIGLYLNEFPNGSLGSTSTIYISLPDKTLSGNQTSTCASLGLATAPTGYVYQCTSPQSIRDVDGTGWMPVNLKQLSTGSPIGSLPVDPSNTSSTNLFYTYSTDGSSYVFTALPESQKQKQVLSLNPQIPNYPDVMAQGSDVTVSPLFSATGLMGYWPFDEGSGTTTSDISGLGHNGALGGGTMPAWQASTNCKVGNSCLYFNTNYVQMVNAGFVTTNGHTLMAWINPTVLAVNTNIFASFGLPYISFHASGNRPFTSASITGQKSINGVTPISVGTWYLVAGTYDNATLKLYVNGILDTSLATSGPDGIGATLCVGAHSCSSYWTNGIVDDVRAYNRALSASEIQEIYNAEK